MVEAVRNRSESWSSSKLKLWLFLSLNIPSTCCKSICSVFNCSCHPVKGVERRLDHNAGLSYSTLSAQAWCNFRASLKLGCSGHGYAWADSRQVTAESEFTMSDWFGLKGLLDLKCNPPMASTAHRSNGFNMGFVSILDKPESVSVYAAHPAHLEYVTRLQTNWVGSSYC